MKIKKNLTCTSGTLKSFQNWFNVELEAILAAPSMKFNVLL